MQDHELPPTPSEGPDTQKDEFGPEDPVSQVGPEQGSSRSLVDPDAETTGITVNDSDNCQGWGPLLNTKALGVHIYLRAVASFLILVPSESFSE